MIFDLRTNGLVRSIVFPEDVLRPHSVLTNLIVDESIQGKCDSAFVYISDSVAPGEKNYKFVYCHIQIKNFHFW